jgi:hypothetical protein
MKLSRQNVRKRLERAIARANDTVAEAEGPLIPAGLTLHSLRRTFA